MSAPPTSSTPAGASPSRAASSPALPSDVFVSPTCPWEDLCSAVLAIRSLRRRTHRGANLRFFLPQGWRVRLEESLYEAFRESQVGGATEFLESLDTESSCVPLTYSTPFAVRRTPKLLSENPPEPLLAIGGPEELLISLDLGDVRTDPEVASLLSNRGRLQCWRNRFQGRRAFVIGNGPSLRGTNLRALAGEFTLGSNGLFLLDRSYFFRPTFYVVEDRLVAEDRQREIQAYEGAIKFFPWDQRDRLLGDAYLPVIRSYAPYPQFSVDIASEVFTGWSVTYLLLQLAYFAGARAVYLVGVDGTYPAHHGATLESVVVAEGPDTNHFDPEYFGKGRRYHQPQRARVEAAYECARGAFEAAGGGVWNATVGGELEVFPRVPLSHLVPEAVL